MVSLVGCPIIDVYGLDAFSNLIKVTGKLALRQNNFETVIGAKINS
jgi:hypothetical protein